MTKTCPKCHKSIKRSHRNGFTRAIDIIAPIYQYKCKNTQCNWQGLVVPTSSKKRLIKVFVIAVMSLVFIVMAVYTVEYLLEYSAYVQNKN